MQLLIDEFRNIYDSNDEACRARDDVGWTTEEGGGTASYSSFHEPERSLRGAGWMTARTSIPSGVPSGNPSYDPTEDPSSAPSGRPSATFVPTATSGPSVSSGPTIDPGPWDPFHPDIQKTIHFW